MTNKNLFDLIQLNQAYILVTTTTITKGNSAEFEIKKKKLTNPSDIGVLGFDLIGGL